MGLSKTAGRMETEGEDYVRGDRPETLAAVDPLDHGQDVACFILRLSQLTFQHGPNKPAGGIPLLLESIKLCLQFNR